MTLTVESIQHISCGALVTSENLHGNDRRSLGDTVGLASNRTGNVSSVTDSVGSGSGHGAVTQRGTSTKVGVGCVDAGIDNVGIGSSTSAGVVDVAA